MKSEKYDIYYLNIWLY